MGNKKLKSRNEIDNKFKWDIEAMYDSDDVWNKDLSDALSMASEFEGFKGHLGDSAAKLAEALIRSDEIELKLERVYVYSRMKLDEDNRDPGQQAMYDKAMTAIARISALMSFVAPELTSIEEKKIREFMSSEPKLGTYRHLLDSILKQKAHVSWKNKCR